MTRNMLYPFLGSSAIHLTIFIILLSLTGTGEKIRNNKVSFSEVSFVGHEDSKMTSIMKNIAELKKQAPGLILFNGKIKPGTGGTLTETFSQKPEFGKRRKSIPVKPSMNMPAEKPSHTSFPTFRNNGDFKDLFIENKKTAVKREALSGRVEKGGFMKNQRPERKTPGFKSKTGSSVKDISVNEITLPADRLIWGGAEDRLSDTPGASASGRANSPAQPLHNPGKSFYSSGYPKEKDRSDSPIDSSPPEKYPSFNRGSLKHSSAPPDKDIPLHASSPGKDVGITITGEIKNRKIIKSYMPPYPAWLEGEGVEPVVVLRFTVLPAGHIKNRVFVKRTSGFTKLDKLAIKAMKKWIFAPLSGKNFQREETGEIAFRFLLK